MLTHSKFLLSLVISSVLFVCSSFADSKQRSRWVSKETRVVEGLPEKISSPRWPTKRIANAVLFFCWALTTQPYSIPQGATFPQEVIDFVFNTSIILIVYCNQFISILCLLFVFCYIVDYYIYKALKEYKMERKKWLYSAKTVFFYQLSQSIGVLAKNIRILELKIMGI